MSSNEIYLRTLPYLDKKWIKADLNLALRCPDDLANLFNHLIQDEELSTIKFQPVLNNFGNFAYLRSDGKYYCGAETLTCTCCSKVCNASTSCVCSACAELNLDDSTKKLNTSNISCNQGSSENILNAWLWGPVPST